MKYIRALLKWLGWSTWYHVHATAQNRTVSGCGTYQMRPWLHHDNYEELRRYIAEQYEVAPEGVILVAITGLGK